MQDITEQIKEEHYHDLPAAYEELATKKLITPDPAQRDIITKLQRLREVLPRYTSEKDKSWFAKIISGKEASTIPHGLYIYGGVGRGKSMLMDLFFSTSPIEKKRRVHFHAFMMEIHEKLQAWRQQTKDDEKSKNPIPPLARALADEAWLLCFDEFQVTDIADAMILGRLFTELFKEGVVVVATSNRHPDDLYKDGLQREHFLPFIDLLKSTMEVAELSSETDYRLEHLKSLKTTFLAPLGNEASVFLKESFRKLTYGAAPEPITLSVLGRKIHVPCSHGDVAMFSFGELCEQPLGAADYIEIAREFSTVLLADIPQMTSEKRNEAKRFVTLIDALYEHKVKLICTAETSPQALYIDGHGAFEFERTASRLIEMQSESYLAAGHLA